MSGPAEVGPLAAGVLEEVLEGAPADRTLKRALRAHPELDNDARRALSRRVFRVALHRARLTFLAGGLDDLPPSLRARALLAVHLAVDEGAPLEWAFVEVGLVEPGAPARRADAPPDDAPIACRSEPPGIDEDVLARVRVALENPPRLPEDPVERLAVARSLPGFLARLFATERGLEDADRLLAVMNEPGPITLRANLRMNPRDELRARLADEGIPTRPTALSPWGLVVEEGERRPNLWGSVAFREGAFEVQDEGSQLIALATAAAPGETVVDLCAGRGGKTLALAASMNGRGRLIATDVDTASLKDLDVRLRRAGETWVEACHLEAAGALDDLVGQADRVLVDAPCSSLGTLRRGPDRRWLLDEAELARLPLLQREILARAVPLLRPGGELVYATCTLAEDENERVADWLCGRFPELEPCPLALDVARGAARHTLLPHVHGTDGFFLASFARRS